MKRNIFINLPVENLDKTVEFFTKLGFTFNKQFTNEKATCMIVEENIFVMLLVEEFFKTFTKKELIDRKTQVGQLISLNMESKEAVNSFVENAIKNGGTQASEPTDNGFMYQNSFDDINGYTWEIFWMDENYVEKND